MKAILSNTPRTVPATGSSLKEKISLLSEHDFLWHEIAALADLPKKLIKQIAKGTYIPGEVESEYLSKRLDKVIKKLNITADTNDASCPEADLDAEAYQFIKLGVKSVTLYKGTDDDKMIVQIHGEMIHD